MDVTLIQTASRSVAEQIALSMSGLTQKRASEQVYAFALVVADDFASVAKAANTEGHYRRSPGGPVNRWLPSEWFATGMDLEIDHLNELLGDPTFQADPELEKQRPATQAVWLKPLVESLRIAREAGHLTWGGRSVAAFCTVEDSGLAGWFALESARLANPPDLLKMFEAELSEAWAGWESDEESARVRAAYDALRVGQA